jgi:hypothetical protein
MAARYAEYLAWYAAHPPEPEPFGPNPLCECCQKCEAFAFQADPFAEEIHGDSTPIWQCETCSYNSAMDI